MRNSIAGFILLLFASQGYAGSNVQTLSTDSNGRMHAQLRDGTSDTVLTQGSESVITVADDSDCGTGNVCSGEFSPTFSSNVNCVGGAGLTHLRSWFTRTGKNVEVTTMMNCDPDAIALTSFIIDEASLPFSPSIVAASNNCMGNGTHEDGGAGGNYAAVQILASDPGCVVQWVTLSNSNARMVLKYSYILE